jgi:Peptidase A4 family
MRPKLRLLLAAWGAAGLVPAMLMVAAGPAGTASAARASLVRAPSADAGNGSPLPADPLEPDATQWTSQEWSGWADVAKENVNLRFVTANFTVPTVKCGALGQSAYLWVGLDGFAASGIPVPNNNTVEQAGVAVVCNVSTPSGPEPSYYSFWEMFAPGPGHGPHTKGGVSPGDVIAVSVFYNSAANDYNLQLNDSNSTTPDISTAQSCPSGNICHNATAEVIAEDPGGGPAKGVYLANFHTVNFTSVGVTSRNGTKGALQGNSLWTANKITMAYQGTVMAKPSARTNNYHDFSDTWNYAG